jgi:hypothetical protein
MVPKIPIEKELSLLYPLFPSLFSSLEFFVVTRSHLYFCNLWKVLACAETHGTAADEWFFFRETQKMPGTRPRCLYSRVRTPWHVSLIKHPCSTSAAACDDYCMAQSDKENSIQHGEEKIKLNHLFSLPFFFLLPPLILRIADPLEP